MLRRLTVALTVSLALLAAEGSSAGVSATGSAVGTLSLSGRLSLVASSVPGCPVVPPATVCVDRTIAGALPGLGQVAAKYSYLVQHGPPVCAPAFVKALGYPIRLSVASKGELELAVAEGTTCVDDFSGAVRQQEQTFTITGGTGIYAGASGSGTLQRLLGTETCDSTCHRDGYETLTASLTVAGHEFDVKAPTFAGTTSRTVKAKRGARSARVTYQVTAQDDRDGSVPAACSPKSGSRFKLGRTSVRCRATDSSANTDSASFTITVRRTR